MGLKWNHKVSPNQQAYLQAEGADTILEHMNRSPSHSVHSNLSIPPSACSVCKITVRSLHRLHPSRNTEANKKPTVRIIRGLNKNIYEINLKELGLLVQRKKISDTSDDESLLFAKA